MTVIESQNNLTGALRRMWRISGAPVNGTTLADVADPGDILARTDTPFGFFQNRNTKTSPTWTEITPGGGTLDSAYDYGGAGVGKAITVDSGAVALTNNAADNNGVLTVEKSPVGAQSGNLVTLTMGAQASGAALVIANSGSGDDITGTAGWSIQSDGDATFLAITLANATLPAGTSCYIGRDNTGDVTVNALVAKSVNLAVAGTDVVTVAGAAVTIAQALTVSTGGAAITGNSTVTGDLNVTGSLTFGGNWTVAATLTVDELILDTDGSAPAATNCYAIRDNGGDLTVNAVTAKQFIVAIAGTDEFTFSATILDFADNAADNVGFLILNAATAPAAGEVYLVNDNTGDLTLNALTGKDVILAINGVDEVKFDDAAHIFNDASNDRDFRVESGGMAYAIYSDGGKDALVLGSNTDTSLASQLITISRAARSNTDATSYYDVAVQPAGAVTTTGVTPIVASVYLAEPLITVGGGSVTVAATLYIASQPTEGGANAGLVAADDVDLAIGSSVDCILRWSTADADNHALALGIGASLAAHICQAADIATDWNVAAASNPTVYIHGATTPATEYIAISTDETDAHLNSVGANWSIEIGGTPELTLTNAALNLAANSLEGGTASGGDLTLVSTTHGTKGCVTIANAEQGIKIGATTDRATTEGTNQLVLFNGTAPIGTLANGVTVYSTGGECYIMDAGGNATLQSQHDADGDLILLHYSAKQNKTRRVYLEKLLHALAGDPQYSKFFEETPGLKHNKEWAGVTPS